MASSSMRSADLLGKRKLGDDLETKLTLRKHKETSEEKDSVEGFDQTSQFLKEPAVTTNTLLVVNLSPETEISVLISDIIDFFKNVAKLVRVQLTINRWGEHLSCGFVEFASSNEAKKALHKKNGEYLHGHKIFLDVATAAPPPKYCVDHKVVWYEEDYRERLLLIEKDDLKTKPNVKKSKMGGFCRTKIIYTDGGHLQQVSLPLEEDETPPDSVEEVLFVANLSPQTEIPHIIDFFEDVGKVQVRLIVNQEGKHVGYGFVEFAFPCQAKEALEMKNGEYLHEHKIFLDVAKTAPYAPRSNCNLAEKLCYEDYLQRVSLLVEEDETIERLCETSVFDEAVAVTEKTIRVSRLSRETKISHIIDFFKDVGGVVHVRLRINDIGGLNVGYGYVEFASTTNAKKALQMKNGKCLHNRKVVLSVAKMLPTKYCIDYYVWYEDYLRRDSLLIDEDEAMEGHGETPDLVEEVAVTKRTLFVAILPYRISLGISYEISDRISEITHFFAGEEVVRVRLSVNRMGEHVGCGFVELASANRVKKLLDKEKYRWNRKFLLDVVKAAPYPLRPKYNIAEKLWYEDYFVQFGEDYLEIKAKSNDVLSGNIVEFCGKKITFDDEDC